MPRAFVGLVSIILAAGGLGCEATRGPSPQPTNCWVGLHGEYRLLAADGSDPGAAAVEEAARIIHARISRVGLADFEVRTRSDGVIEIDLTRLSDATEVHALIRAVGHVQFVPIPEGTSIEEGEALPQGLTPLFGREGLSSVTPGSSAAGQSALDITLNSGAARVFTDYTARSIGQQFAIVIDGVVLSAPSIQARLEGTMQISGMDETVANRLATILSFPELPGMLDEMSFNEVVPAPGCTPTN